MLVLQAQRTPTWEAAVSRSALDLLFDELASAYILQQLTVDMSQIGAPV